MSRVRARYIARFNYSLIQVDRVCVFYSATPSCYLMPQGPVPPQRVVIAFYFPSYSRNVSSCRLSGNNTCIYDPIFYSLVYFFFFWVRGNFGDEIVRNTAPRRNDLHLAGCASIFTCYHYGE